MGLNQIKHSLMLTFFTRVCDSLKTFRKIPKNKYIYSQNYNKPIRINMSDSEQSDSIDDLQDILAEYDVKAKSNEDKVNPTISTKKSERLKRNLEVPMDKVIFGDKDGLIKKMIMAIGEEEEDSENDDEVNDAIKEEIAEKDISHIENSQLQLTVSQATKRKAEKRKPAWIDADDVEIQLGEVRRETKHTGPLDHLRMDKTYKEYLTKRFTSIVAQPKWANLDKKKPDRDNAEDDELLHTVGFLAKPPAGTLKQHQIQFKRLKDLNRATYKEGSISSICFHPTSTAALVAGDAGIATIYSIDGEKNEKLHSIGFENFPICCARITPCGTKAFFGSKQRFFYSYDLLSAQELRHSLPRKVTTLKNFVLSPCGRYLAAAGRFGELHLFEAASKELVHSYKQENPVVGISFTADSSRIICSSKSSEVTIFSVRTQRVEHTFFDDGCIKGSVLDLAPNQRLLATGSREGVVNVYDFDKVFTSKTPQPEKSIMNLTTSISSVRFNHSSELLAMSSGIVPSAVKLVHFPSCTVYANFPSFNNELGKIGTMEFSPTSGYLALGNRVKEVPLFRLKHFKNY